MAVSVACRGIDAIDSWGVVGVGIYILGSIVAIGIDWANSRPIAKPLRVWSSLSLAVLKWRYWVGGGLDGVVGAVGAAGAAIGVASGAEIRVAGGAAIGITGGGARDIVSLSKVKLSQSYRVVIIISFTSARAAISSLSVYL